MFSYSIKAWNPDMTSERDRLISSRFAPIPCNRNFSDNMARPPGTQTSGPKVISGQVHELQLTKRMPISCSCVNTLQDLIRFHSCIFITNNYGLWFLALRTKCVFDLLQGHHWKSLVCVTYPTEAQRLTSYWPALEFCWWLIAKLSLETSLTITLFTYQKSFAKDF